MIMSRCLITFFILWYYWYLCIISQYDGTALAHPCPLEIVFQPVFSLVPGPNVSSDVFPFVDQQKRQRSRARITWHILSAYCTCVASVLLSVSNINPFQETGSGNSVSKLNGALQLDHLVRFLKTNDQTRYQSSCSIFIVDVSFSPAPFLLSIPPSFSTV